MRVFTKGTLRAFWRRHPDSEAGLQSWYKTAERADWNTPSDLLASSANVRILRNDRAIFNIKGNSYRLVVYIDYPLKRVYIRFVGTHAEYDRINAWRFNMAKITAVNNDDDLAAAVARVDELFKANPDILNAGPDNPEYQELNAIADLVFAYEDIHCPIPDPPPGAFIEYELERLALTPEALIPALGSRETVDAVLAGRQEVTPAMAAALYELLDIDVRDLLPQAAGAVPNI